MTTIVPLSTVVDQARAFAAAARAERTRAEYGKQWHAFAVWCSARGLEALPALPGTLALYLTDRATAGLKPSSLNVAIAAVRSAHMAAGVSSPHKHPQVSEIWQGIRRTLGTRPRRVAPVLIPGLRQMAAACPDTLIGTRDRALLLFGFAGAFRRSELCALQVTDLELETQGYRVRINRSKVDQIASGADVGIPFGTDPRTCPVRAMQAWLAAAGLTHGPVFRNVNRHGRVGEGLDTGSVARIVKRCAATVGLDARAFSGHSLRAGLATTAAKAHKSDRAIMAQGRWSSRSTVDKYVRDACVLDDDNAAGGIGL